MHDLVSVYVVYQITKRLTIPFADTPAFKYGIIDKEGNVLKPMSTLRSSEERAAWTNLDVLINNIKRLLMKAPGGASQIFTFAAALWLLREPVVKLHEARTMTALQLSDTIFKSNYLTEAATLTEDAPANMAGSGAIAGLGVGPQGEPAGRLPKKKKKRRLVRS